MNTVGHAYPNAIFWIVKNDLAGRFGTIVRYVPSTPIQVPNGAAPIVFLKTWFTHHNLSISYD
jgi:hypothetical protein